MSDAPSPSLSPVPAAGSRTLVMGVLNVTPDSFSDGGRYLDHGAAIARGLELARQGADIVDVGGESTKPGAAPVPQEEELRRILPVVRALAAEGVAISIDTLHAETARAAVEAGAVVVNDVSGGEHDPAMRRLVAEMGASYVAMHWRGIPDPEHRRSSYRDVVAEVRDELARLADAAIAAGIAPERLVLDPGLGFDKTTEQGWQLLAGLPRLAELGHPVMIGVSRKRMIAETLRADRAAIPSDRALPMSDRDSATAVVSALASGAGAWAVRVHEVAATVHALAVADAWAAGAAASGLSPSLAANDTAPPPSGGLPPSSASALPPSSVDGPRPSSVDGPPPSSCASEASRRIHPLQTPPARQGQDRIELTGLDVFAHHGVFDFERERGQRFLVDAELAVDLRPAADGDALERTVHYGELAVAIVAAVERDPVDLIETVAERVAGVALGFPGVAEARITVHKPDAPIDAPFADVSVTVVRRPGEVSS